VRRAVLYRELRKVLGGMFRSLAQQKECRIEEGHLLGDHVHMLISIPPKYAVAEIVLRYIQEQQAEDKWVEQLKMFNE
jgi:putative transposase